MPYNYRYEPHNTSCPSESTACSDSENPRTVRYCKVLLGTASSRSLGTGPFGVQASMEVWLLAPGTDTRSASRHRNGAKKAAGTALHLSRLLCTGQDGGSGGPTGVRRHGWVKVYM